MLSVDVAATLGGRYLTREVLPFSFSEYLAINGIDSNDRLITATTADRGVLMRQFEEYFQFGGFPECATMPVKRDYLTSLYQKIFLGDIAARHKVENIFALRVLFRKLAESVKQPLSFTRATNIVASTGTKIGKSTVINYLSYALDAYLLIVVPNIADNITERVTNPKYYFIDNGIISLLAVDIRTSLLETWWHSPLYVDMDQKTLYITTIMASRLISIFLKQKWQFKHVTPLKTLQKHRNAK